VQVRTRCRVLIRHTGTHILRNNTTSPTCTSCACV
jgi:hypothetical protein